MKQGFTGTLKNLKLKDFAGDCEICVIKNWNDVNTKEGYMRTKVAFCIIFSGIDFRV